MERVGSHRSTAQASSLRRPAGPFSTSRPGARHQKPLVEAFAKLADDLDGNGSRVGDAFCSVPAVGEDLLDERKCVTRGGQNRAAAVAVLDIGAMRLRQQVAPVRVEKCTALAALEFLPAW